MAAQLNQEKLKQTIKLQQIASNPENCVFVSASAGSGKTKILTDRVLRLLLLGTNPHKILCLTFTKIAAFEMQNRIYKELSNWSILTEEDLKQRIFDLTGVKFSKNKINESKTLFNVILDDFEGIKINTIHSFCQNLMTKFPIEADIKPNFQIIDSQTEHSLLLEAKDTLLREAVNDEELSKKIEIISANLNENSFLEIILELINKRTDLEITKEKFFGLDNLNKTVFKILNCQNKDEAEILNLIKNPNFDNKNLEILGKLGQNSNKTTDNKHSNLILNYLENPNEDTFNQYCNAFLTKKNEPKKQVFTKKILEGISQAEEIIKLEQTRLTKLIEQINSFYIANLTTKLLEVGDKMLQLYQELKTKNSYLDYHDLIAKSSKLLTNKDNSDWIKYKLDGNIEHILVDESQDTNNNQWQIIKAISEDFFSGNSSNLQNRTIFVVGDEKQSIYNFQGADPEIFGNTFNYYQSQLQAANKKIQNISLNNSFRSLKNILKVVDDVFKNSKYQKAISKINLVNHTSIRTQGSGKVELWPIINVPQDKKREKDDFSWQLNFDPNQNQNSKEILAKIIAKKIKSWLDDKRILKSEKRAIRPRDIMILLKNRTNNLGNLIIKNLQKEDILVNGSDKIELIKNIIVKDLLSLAKFLLLNEDDLNLASLLKSPLINICEDDLFDLCKEKDNKQISLFAALRNVSHQPSANKDICHRSENNFKSAFLFLEEVKKYYQENPYQIYQLFLHILEIKNKKTAIISHFGKESKEIINQFLNLCLNFQQDEIASLENFICSLDNFDLNIKIDTSNNNFDEVKITTIHSAKGLEAPIVILADCLHDSKSQYGANKDKILWLNKGQVKIPIWSAGKESELTKSIKDNEHNIKQEEYLRLLYVAMTRAKDELYIAGFGKNTNNDCWYNIIKNNALLQGQTKKSHFKELINLDDQNFLEDDKIFFLEEKGEAEIMLVNNNKNKKENFVTPDFLHKKSKKEKTINILYPSDQKTEVITKSSLKKHNHNIGKIIHKILEICHNKSPDLINKYLENNYHYLDKDEKKEILRQVANIFENKKFDFLFQNNSKSEVPIIGKIDNQLVLGQVDHLIINKDEIIIIDYKSDQLKVDNIKLKTAQYQKQLDLYAKIIQEIYPNKKIKCAIIWTYLGEISYL